MPTSEKQIEANRRNARKSTGPSTPEGKAAIRRPLKHGILARETVITRDDCQEDATEFETLLDELTADRDPQGPVEGLLVQEIAICYWRLRRILRADTMEFGEVLAQQGTPTFEIEGRTYQSYPPSLPPADQLDTILRYEKAIHNQLARALSQLERLQQQRKSAAMSTVTPSQPSTPPGNGETKPIAPSQQPAAADADPAMQQKATKQSHLPANTARSRELRELELLMQEAQQTVGSALRVGSQHR